MRLKSYFACCFPLWACLGIGLVRWFVNHWIYKLLETFCGTSLLWYLALQCWSFSSAFHALSQLRGDSIEWYMLLCERASTDYVEVYIQSLFQECGGKTLVLYYLWPLGIQKPNFALLLCMKFNVTTLLCIWCGMSDVYLTWWRNNMLRMSSRHMYWRI